MIWGISKMVKIETKQFKKNKKEAEEFELHGVSFVKNPPEGCNITEVNGEEVNGNNKRSDKRA